MPRRLRGLGERLARALAFPFEALPALVLAWLCLRIAEAIHASGAGVPQATLFGAALGNDLLSLLRFGFVFLLGALPLALIPSTRWRTLALGLVWSALLFAHAALMQYHWAAGVPLGADLFARSSGEVRATIAGGRALSPLLGIAFVSALAILWTLLSLSVRAWWPRAGASTVFVLLAASVLAFVLLPQRFAPPVVRTEAELAYLGNKTAFFIDRTIEHLRNPAGAGVTPAADAGDVGVAGLARAGAAGVFQATFTNRATARSPQFVPLLVVTNEHGLQLLESAAPLRTLAPGESATITWQPELRKGVPGTYFVSALPPHPATGRSLGGGQYHVEAGL